MLLLLSNSLVLIGVIILIGSMLTVTRIMRRLPLSRSRISWYVMAGLIGLFVISYLGYMAVFWGRQLYTVDLIVPSVFFFGACFVWLSTFLALQTAMDVMRITTLEHETFTDPLTGIYNRRFMQQRLAEEVSKARRYNFDLAVLLLDLDHFKQVNDNQGHQAGDQLLVEISGLVSLELRDSDIFARYGGEEFLIIAPNTAPTDAARLAERLRSKIESIEFLQDFDSAQQHRIRITTSIGVANFGASITSEENLIGVADSNLYKAKHAGRNRIATGLPDS